MNAGLILVSVAIGAALLAGCDRAKQADTQQQTAVPVVMSKPLPPQVQPLPPQAPPQVPPQTPSTASASNNANTPIQGQIDVKEPAQRRAFETK